MDEKDDLMARTMVENLSIGINPLSQAEHFHRQIAAPTRWYKKR